MQDEASSETTLTVVHGVADFAPDHVRARMAAPAARAVDHDDEAYEEVGLTDEFVQDFGRGRMAEEAPPDAFNAFEDHDYQLEQRAIARGPHRPQSQPHGHRGRTRQARPSSQRRSGSRRGSAARSSSDDPDDGESDPPGSSGASPAGSGIRSSYRPAVTYKRCNERWCDLLPAERLQAFLELPEADREEADRNFSNRLDAVRWAELNALREDAGLDPLPAAPRPIRRTYRPPALGEDFDDEALDRISPPEYIEALTGEVVPPHGGTVCCPFPDHDDRTPSARVYAEPERGFYCWGCGRGGTAVDLAATITGITPRGSGYREIRRWLAERLLQGGA